MRSSDELGAARPRPVDSTSIDVLYLTDLRFPGGSSSSLVEEARAAVAVGYRVGVLHCQSSSLRQDRAFHPGIRSMLDDGSLILVRPDEPVNCGVAIVKHPTILTKGFGGRLGIRSQQNLVFVGQVPSDDDGTVYYDPAEVHRHAIEALGEPPVWCPVSPTVRSHLEGGGVPLADDDWVEVIDLKSWAVERTGPLGGRPVIGRHGRPTPMKWPEDPEDFLAAYPIDGRAAVRVLGGIDGLEGFLGDRVPESWEVHGFGRLEPGEFLRGVDFFVYFHHRDLVEAFGRTVLEALASGCVVVLPPHFESLFGDACVYVEPRGVWSVIESLHGSPSEFLRVSEHGVDEVRRRFSHEAHVGRLRGFLGKPGHGSGRAAPTGQLPKGLRDQRPSVLMACVGMAGAAVAETIRQLEEHRDRATGFAPVVLATVPPPDIARHLDEDLLLDADRRSFIGSRSGIVVEAMESRDSYVGPDSFDNYLLGKITEIRRRHRIGSVSAVDIGHPDAWLVLQAATG